MVKYTNFTMVISAMNVGGRFMPNWMKLGSGSRIMDMLLRQVLSYMI
uniref:Uncharacterized protein n=1 Tax=Rhizophora mucronata TaxID=61149 RepID=A0A2P2QAQ5_RHIMU